MSRPQLVEYPADQSYRLIEPGPVILIATQAPPRESESTGRKSKRRRTSSDAAAAAETETKIEKSRPNVMTCGFHMVVQHSDPPLLAVCVGPWDSSFATLKSTRECVIAVPPVALAEKVVDIGNCSGEDVDKFDKFGLTAVEGGEVGAPLIEECIANLECRVKDTTMVKKYNMWVLQVVKVWIRKDDGDEQSTKTFHHKGDGTFVVDGDVIDLKDKMVLWKQFQD